MNMIDWKKKYDKQLLQWAENHYWDSFEKDKIIILRHLKTFAENEEIKKQSMIEKLEADKAELLEALKGIDESINDNCISDAQMMIKNIIKQVSGEI
jgi:hypothetical protein